MNILVTSGGIREKIDSVRGITNFSTGRLGSLIAERLCERCEVSRVIYLRASGAVLPENQAAEVYTVDGSRELEAAVCEILAENRVDAIVHSMAVSDYRVAAVTTRDGILESARLLLDVGKPLDSELFSNSAVLDRDGKISSDESGLVLLLEPVPKIIALMRELAPEAVLVGFKLLDNVPEDTLIGAAYDLLVKNGCAYVLANDQRSVCEDHVGYLVGADRRAPRLVGKNAIARAIADAVIAGLARRGEGAGI